ncbi:MAG: ATP-binding protein [Candidatus Marinimicrobia bacterium]|nr:ATP-binding protein [Candidatus Neomarinimicrobiota bacterium]
MIKKGEAIFQTRGRLLQELGERLVAKADVALMELIKNSYDADASFCEVIYDGESVIIKDDGQGMNEEEFLSKWMYIATPSKQRELISRRFRRNVTGSKGIGRFAVRYLGKKLRLETISNYPGEKVTTQLSVDFDWMKLDEAKHINEIKIPYEIVDVDSDVKPGTKLVITDLHNANEIVFDKQMRTDLLSIIDPYSGLDNDRFTREGKSDSDPGFTILLPESDVSSDENLAKSVLDNSLLRLTINLAGQKAIIAIVSKNGRCLLEHTIGFENYIQNGLFADIRYLPRRAGVFKGAEVDGRQIWSWLRDNGGVGIVDHGFRIRPYGYPDNDWLNLGLDTGYNRRHWRSKIMEELYPMSPDAISNPRSNPMLYLPSFHQLIGAVYVESTKQPDDITPAMDREGFISNQAFKQLVDLIRTGLEMLAYADHTEQRRMEAEAAKKAAESMRKDFQEAIKYVNKIPSLSEGDRQQVVKHFQRLTHELKDVQDYQKTATSRMEMVALLGILAGFLTHEMRRLIHDLDSAIKVLSKLSGKHGLKDEIASIIRTREEIAGQIQFASTYISNVQAPYTKNVPLNAKQQIKRVVDRYEYFAENRNVDIQIDVDPKLMTPAIPVALYGGIILNLYSNALKAISGGQGSDSSPKIVIKAWNDSVFHLVEVADTGVGIPESLRDRIWDPLFTTTSGGTNNPLGSGMGLGLSLVRKLISEVGGRIRLVDPPPGYNTCFKVQFQKVKE